MCVSVKDSGMAAFFLGELKEGGLVGIILCNLREGAIHGYGVQLALLGFQELLALFICHTGQIYSIKMSKFAY